MIYDSQKYFNILKMYKDSLTCYFIAIILMNDKNIYVQRIIGKETHTTL